MKELGRVYSVQHVLYENKTFPVSSFHSTKKQLPASSELIEEVQLDFIGPITGKNQRFHIYLSMDRYSKCRTASFWKRRRSILEQYLNLIGIPKTIESDQATAIAGIKFEENYKKHHIKLIHGTSYFHNPTRLDESRVITLKQTLNTNMKRGKIQQRIGYSTRRKEKNTSYKVEELQLLPRTKHRNQYPTKP